MSLTSVGFLAFYFSQSFLEDANEFDDVVMKVAVSCVVLADEVYLSPTTAYKGDHRVLAEQRLGRMEPECRDAGRMHCLFFC